jgi:hypothetical protein
LYAAAARGGAFKYKSEMKSGILGGSDFPIPFFFLLLLLSRL